MEENKKAKIKTSKTTKNDKIKTDGVKKNKQIKTSDKKTIVTISKVDTVKEEKQVASSEIVQDVIQKCKKIEETKPTPRKKTVFGISEVVTLLILTLIFSFGFGVVLGINNYKKSSYDPNLEELLKNYNYIKENYYGEIDYKKMMKGAIEGMINNVGDENSWFIEDGDNNSTFYRQLNGTYYGLGVEVSNTADLSQIVIRKVFKNSPAEKAGLLPNDILVSLNGMDMSNRPSADLSTFVSNNPDATFEIKVVRNNQEKSFTLKNGNIAIDSVRSKIYEQNNKKTGYIQVDIFALNTYSQFKKELRELEKQNIESLIIDLRGNSGGYFDVTKQMISLFLDSSNVIFQTESKKEKEKIYSLGDTTKKYKIVVLVDGGSASASEVMAAALQEKYGATLIGEKTYGKGTVQQINNLPTGDQYKITNKVWLTPAGKNIHKIGIEPNIKIALNAEYYKNPIEENDNQLKAALEHLKK